MESFLKSLPENFELQEFKLEKVLGQGGFGITYLAFDMNLMQHVAIKEYYPREFANRDSTFTIHAVGNKEDKDTFTWGLKRFLDEARVLAQLSQPNIISVKRFFEAHGTAYLVMEYCDGKPLDEIIRDHGPLNETELNGILYPLLDGLEHVHEKAFLHRDIKPANIFIRRNGSPVLLDFGAAKHEMTSHSKSVTSLATAGYAPFEQYSTKGKQGPWSDIYGLAATIYRAISGIKPQDAPDRMLEDTLEPATELLKGKFNTHLLKALDKALSIRPDARPQTIAEFRNLIRPQQIANSTVSSSPENIKVQAINPESHFITQAVIKDEVVQGMALAPGLEHEKGLVVDGGRLKKKFFAVSFLVVIALGIGWLIFISNSNTEIATQSNTTQSFESKETPIKAMPVVEDTQSPNVELTVQPPLEVAKPLEEKKETPKSKTIVSGTIQPPVNAIKRSEEKKEVPQPKSLLPETKQSSLEVAKPVEENKEALKRKLSALFSEIDGAIEGGQLAKAQNLLGDVLRNNPDSAAAHFRMGQIFAKEEKYQQAREQLNKAKQIDPSLRFTTTGKFQELYNEMLAMEKMFKVPGRD